MTMNWLAVKDEGRLLDEVANRRARLAASRLSVTPAMATAAGAYGDAYPWMDPTLAQSFVQAGVAPDDPRVQQIATESAQMSVNENTIPADDLPDPWYESLWNAATGWAKPAIRTGFAVISTPFEELQALLSSAGTALFDETEAGPQGLVNNLVQNVGDVIGELARPDQLLADFWTNYTQKAARSHGILALSDMYDLGEGYLPGGSAYAAREEAKHRLQLDGEFVTPGRLIARMVTEPGSDAYQVLSGLNDLAQNIFLDPAAIALGGLSKANKAVRLFQSTGMIDGLRHTADVPRAVNHFLTSNVGRQYISYLTKTDDIEDAWRAIGHGPIQIAERLRASTDDTTTFEILNETLGHVIRERPTAGFMGRTVGHIGGDYGALFGGGSSVRRALSNTRVGLMMPEQFLDTGNITHAARQLDAWMRNARTPDDLRKLRMQEIANVKDGDGTALFGVVESIMKDTRGLLVKEWGVTDSTAGTLTQLYRTSADDMHAYGLDDMGRHQDVVAPFKVTLGDEVEEAPRAMPLLEGEFVDEIIPLPPHARDIRRLTPQIKQMQRLYDSGLWKGSIDGMEAFMSGVWKPLQLLRGAYTFRVIAEEQMRMAGAGYDSLINHPIRAIAWSLSIDPKSKFGRTMARVVDQKGTMSATGDLWDEIVEHRFALSKGSAGWRGMPGEVLTGRYVIARHGDDPRYHDGWAEELIHIANDPVMRRLSGGLKEGDIRSIRAAQRAGASARAGGPGAGVIGAREAREQWDELGDDQLVEVYLSTTPEKAQGMVTRGIKADEKQLGDNATALTGPGVYVGDDPDRLRFTFGGEGPDAPGTVVAVTVRKGDLTNSPEGLKLNASMREQLGDPTLGAVIPGDVPSSRVRLMDEEEITRAPGAVATATTYQPSGNVLDDVKEWYWAGSGSKWRNRHAQLEGREKLADSREAADRYIEEVYMARLERSTGGNTELLDFVARGQMEDVGKYRPKPKPTNKKLGEINPRGFGDQKKLAATLEEFYDEAAPAFVKREESIRVAGRESQWNKVVEGGFNFLMAKPTNYLSRSPVFRQAYWRRMEELMGAADRPTQELIIRGAREAGFKGTAEETRMASAILAGERSAGVRQLTSFEDADLLARGYALSETKSLLYDLHRRSQFFDMTRIIFPFGEAWKEIITSWTRIIRQNPKTLRRFQQAMEGARQPSMLPGAEPETTPGTGQGFFHNDPQTGEEVFTYPGSWAGSLLGLNEGGAGLGFVGRTAGLNLVTATVLPGFGPVVQYPASKLIPQTPQYDDLREMFLPFGGPQGSDFKSQALDLVVPAWLDKFLTTFEDPADHRLFGNTVADVQRALLRSGKYSLNTVEGQQQLYDDAVAKARWLYGIRGIAQSILPTGPSFQWSTTDVAGNVVPVKLLSDDLRALTEQMGGDRNAAFTEWLRRYGPENVLSVISKSTALTERPVTEKGDSWLRAHADLERTYPTTIGFFAPEPAAGEFDYAAYMRQFETGARESITPAEQLELANDFLGRLQWEQAKKIAAMRPGPVTNVWLAQVRTQIAEEYPGFDGWVSRRVWEQKPEVEQMITEIKVAVQDPALAQTDAGAGTKIYLSAIDAAKQMLAGLPGNVTRYQQAKAAAPVRFWLRSVARSIIEDHPDFARVWTGIFERELNDDGGMSLVPPGGGS